MKSLILTISILLDTSTHLSAAAPLRPVTLRCEYRVNPLGVNTPNPRLSWVLKSKQRGARQTAYRLLVASSAALLAKDKGDLWDSGKVASNQSHLVAYAGKPLASHQQVFWKVRVSTSAGTEAESDVGNWTTGFLSPEEWSTHWIAAPELGNGLPAIPFIKVRGEKGKLVRITPAEQHYKQTDRHNNGTGRVNQAGVGKPNYYEYTLNGSGLESWQPQFTYGGFQYLEITGAVPKGHPNPKNLPVVEVLQSIHVRSSATKVGSFSCSNPLFNQIDEVIDRAVRSNMAHVLTDCPTREKLGWLEVSYLMGPSISRRYDLSRLYAKITRDIRESQGEDGAMYTVAPNYPKFRSGFSYTPEWGAAGVVIPWQLYRWYGDKRVLRENLQAMKSFVDYMKKTGKDLIPKAGLGDWYDYGHGKGSGKAKFTPPELTAMATFYRCAGIVSKTAKVLGEKDDAQVYQTLADDIRIKFNQTYYTGNSQYKNNGSPQTANAMALITGLCEQKNEQVVLDAILDDLKKRNYQQTAGDIGFHYLVETLGRYGHHEIVSRILNRHNIGSYGYIVDRGWTSLPEAWDANPKASMNHCMLGHIQQWFSHDLLGIRQAEDSVAFRKVIIKPAFETDVEWAKGHYDAVSGRISVDWNKKNGQYSLNVSIPANTTATVYLPAKNGTSVSESGKPAKQAAGVTSLRMVNGSAAIQIESGQYSFVSQYNQE